MSTMDINLIVFATPIFIILIGLEYVLSCYKPKALYQLNDTVNNLSCGILEEMGTLPIWCN